jgi:hypothetical protein
MVRSLRPIPIWTAADGRYCDYSIGTVASVPFC